MHTKEEKHLQDILQKIEQRLEKVNESISEGQKEIDQMHDYYWQNYTEMDEYGYEHFDNQQALLAQVNANQDQAIYRQRLKKMRQDPYFGRVDFVFDGDKEAEAFYIGIANFSEKNGSVPLIYDWRAPVSGLFYDYDKGPGSYQAPSGEIQGEITSKWQYKIKKQKLLYAFESDTKIDDDILKAELGSKGDVKLKNIIRTIQKEQNQIIRNTKDKILVIQGAAGSGKTSIALHRIAYLLYHEREYLKSSNILILSPNSVFSDYISHILPELGEEHIQEMSFDLFAYHELKKIVYDCEDRYDFLESMMSSYDPELLKRYEEKQSFAMLGLCESFLALLEDDLVSFTDIEYRRFQKSEEELIDLFYNKFQTAPLLKRMDQICDYFVDEYETLKGTSIPEEELEELRAKFRSMYTTEDVYEIYNRMLEFGGYPLLCDQEHARRILPYEDVYPMLYLKARLLGFQKRLHMKHVIIDEMQDYSYLQYELLRELFSCRMTILGDRAQTLDEKSRDVLDFLPKIFGKLHAIDIKKSYRNTIEIANYAGSITGIKDLELLERHGKEVLQARLKNSDALLTELKGALASEEFETSAVICMTKESARAIFQKIKAAGLDATYIDPNSSNFPKGLIVTTWYLAKGLEFDQVFGVFPKDDIFCKDQAKYITATRALHELYMYEL